jgi:hypothetical protein
MNTMPYVSWGVYGGVNASERANYFASWGLWNCPILPYNLKVLIGGAWKIVRNLSVLISGSWKNITSLKVLIGNAWKNI